MTSNRAHKRAARAIAAEKNIRYPEADALAEPEAMSSERHRPAEYTPSADPTDLDLALIAEELGRTDLVIGPGVTGAKDPFHQIRRITSEALGFDDATDDQEVLPIELQKARIVFARRYADMLSAGVHPMKALDFLSVSLRSVPGIAAEKLIDAIPSVKTDIGMGFTMAEAWRPHVELLGHHLHQMIALSDSKGGSPTALRDAADTLEAEMRLGLD